MDYFTLLIGIFAGGIIGFLAAKLIGQPANNFSQENELQQLKIENATLKNSSETQSKDLESYKEDLKNVRFSHENELKKATEWKSKYDALSEKIEDQKKELATLQVKFTKEFELVANKILEEKSNKFTDQNKKNIDAILNPLKEKIGEFQKKVEDTN